MAEVTLSRLTHDVCQNTYKDLHALLDSLGDLPEDRRCAKLVDFFLKMRHRFARLLVAVRWFMSYSAFHSSASATRQLASARSTVFTTDADTLFMVSNVARGAAAQPSAVQEAAEVLGASAHFARIPRIIETSIGLETSADVHTIDGSDDETSNESRTFEPIERLRAATRYLIESSLPNGVTLMKTPAPPNDVAARVGVPGAWIADLVLDRLLLDQALLILLRFEVLVSSHPDAVGPLQTNWHAKELSVRLRKDQSEPLRQMIDDRMRWTYIDSVASGDKGNRVKNVLLCLAQAMSFECAGKIAMEHVRAQALALSTHSSWKPVGIILSGVGSEAADHIPVQIRYWQSSHLKAVMKISLPKEDELHRSETSIIRVEHEPKLSAKGAPSSLSVQSVFIEGLLLESCRARALHELRQLQASLSTEFPATDSKIVSTSLSSISLAFSFGHHTRGLSVGISLKSGGFFVHPFGTISLALTRTDAFARDLRRDIWRGVRFFQSGLIGVKSVLIKLIRMTNVLLSCYSAVESCLAIDAGAISDWPPGVASVEKPEKTLSRKVIRPPFMSIDRKRPRRFMTLLSVANAEDEVCFHPGVTVSKRARILPMYCSSSSDGTLFIEGRRPEGIEIKSPTSLVRSHASAMADWAEIRHAADTRIKRDTILKQLENKRLATVRDNDYSLRSPEYSHLTVKTSPMEVERAALLIQSDDGWKVQLTLTNSIFDAEDYQGQAISYSFETRLLTFAYSEISSTSLDSFGRDLMMVRTAAALLEGLNRESKYYSILRRTPSFIELKSHGLNMTVGFGSKDIEVVVSPRQSLITEKLIPLIEEMLQESGKLMGHTLAALLELSLPIGVALQEAVPNDPTFGIKFTTALRARLTISPKSRHQSYALDIDTRAGYHSVVVIDVSRALRKSSNNNHTIVNQISDIPIWEALLDKIVSKRIGKSIHGASALMIHMSILTNLLSAIVRGVNQQTTASSTK